MELRRGLLATTLLLAANALAYGKPVFVLPDDVLPLRQAVEITIDPARNTFHGVARLTVRINKPQAEIWVNARDLTISEAHIEAGSRSVPVTWKTERNEFLGLTTPAPLVGRDLVLVIAYEAPLSSDGSSGPYRAPVGQDWYAFTTFTPTDARRAFPCFDEPRFKTPWGLSFRVREGDRAFTNTPQLSETREGGGWKSLRFAETPPLPAEVIAFAVGPFDVWEGTLAGEKAIPVRVLTARGNARWGEQAAAETKYVLPRLERYTGIPYPWEKLDHVALPRSAYGAVENPGLITYNGRTLLAEPGKASPEQIRAIRSVEAHELAHQWFGNLVTQASWRDVWLSEGLATWFSGRTLDEEQPADRKRLQSIVARERIMLVDDGPETRPVRLPRQSREEMKSVYSRIVYQKGGAILMMLENWLGPERMQKGIRDYLSGHVFGNATTEDLAASLRTVAEEDPTPLMNSFLDSTGVPRISAQVHCGAPASIVVFKREKGSQPVPVCFHLDRMQSCVTVTDKPRELRLPSCPGFVFPNGHGAGYFRTEWQPDQLRSLGTQLENLDGAERLTLAFDLRAMEQLNVPEVNRVLTALSLDKQPEVAHAARVALGIEREENPPHRN